MPDHKDSSLLKNVAEPKTSTTKRGVIEGKRMKSGRKRRQPNAASLKKWKKEREVAAVISLEPRKRASQSVKKEFLGKSVSEERKEKTKPSCHIENVKEFAKSHKSE
jgi:hypothetical protein